MGKKKKKEIIIPGLSEPWKAYYSQKRERIFYYNCITKESTWELSVVEQSTNCGSVAEKETMSKQTVVPDHSKKESNQQGKEWSKNEAETDGSSAEQMPRHNSFIPSINEQREESMEIDEISLPDISRDDEPMEIDFVVGEVQAYRREHFLLPDLTPEHKMPVADAAVTCMGSNETSTNAETVLIVFDTSCLLQDITLLPSCIEMYHHALIPYTVLRELDGLKKASYEELRLKAIKTTAYLLECAKNGCSFLHIENTFDALSGISEFGCQNNDDIILKCAYINFRRYEGQTVTVVFATNDKNLAVKAAAHNILTANRNELLCFLKMVVPEKVSTQPEATSANRKMTPSEFSFIVPDTPPFQAKENSMKVKPAIIKKQSPVTFTRAKKNRIKQVDEILPGSPGNILRRRNVAAKLYHSAQPSCSSPLAVQKMNAKIGGIKKKRKSYKLSGHSLEDFIETFSSLINHIVQRRNERKSIEDAERLHKVINSMILNKESSLSVLVDVVSKFYDFYSDCDVFVEATHFDKRQLMEEYIENINEFTEKMLEFQKQLPCS